MPAITDKPYAFHSFDDALADHRGVMRPSAAMRLYGDAAANLPPLEPPEPKELLAIYCGGFRGVRPETVSPDERRAFGEIKSSTPRLYDIFPWAKDIGKGKVSAPDQALLHYDPEAGGYEAQTVGSCVSHSCRNAAEIDYANDVLSGETNWKGRLCPEAVYRARGYNGDGWYCEAAAMYVGPQGKGGFLYRQKYEGPGGEVVDLSRFSRDTERWASNGKAGVPRWLEEKARENSARWIIPITTLDEYRDCLAMGFGVMGCSGLGFDTGPDAYGICGQRGSWSHAMAHQACVDTEWAHKQYGGLLGKVQNSWGQYLKQSGKPEGFPIMSQGSFFAKARDIQRILSAGDTFAICGVYGFDRVGPEAFDVSAIAKHLWGSTAQDYYKQRQEKVSEISHAA